MPGWATCGRFGYAKHKTAVKAAKGKCNLSGASFTKLFSSITESTVWGESHATRIVWITMLAMADRKGRVHSSIPGLANRARVTLEECEHALERFLAPDRYSRTPDNDGKRIEPMAGGWQLLNYAKYREMRDGEARKEYMRDYMQDRRKHEKLTVSRSKPWLAKAEAEAEKVKSIVGSGPDIRGQASSVLTFLNEAAGRDYRPVKANLGLIEARLKEGATVEDCKAVIRRKCDEWAGGDMAQYLRPATLFNATKFAQYQGETSKPRITVDA